MQELEHATGLSPITATIQRNITEPDQDGWTWWVLISDGRTARRVKVSLSRSAHAEAGGPMDEDIEPAVRERAERTLTEYGALVKPLPGEITLRADDFR